MSKYNSKVTPSMAKNEMGENAYIMSEKENLVSSVLTTFLQGSYYETENEEVNKIKKAAEACDPLFVAKTALYARQQANMRSVSHLLAADLASRVSGKEWGKTFYERIVVRPDDISEILACYFHKSDKLPHAMRKGFKSAFEKFDPYQLDKYKMKKRQISLVDQVNLLHPKAHSKKLATAYEDLVKNEGKNLHTMYESKILEKEMSKAGTKQGDKKENKAEAIEDVLTNVKGMPMMNLLRNLRNIFINAPDQIDEACKQLTTPAKVKNSRLLPFRFATAYTEIEKLKYKGESKGITFESEREFKMDESEFLSKKEQLLQAIEKALELSCDNIPELEGRTAILIDHSWSVRGNSGGLSRVSAFSKTTTAMIGNLFGNMLAAKQKDTYIGMFGEQLIPYYYDRSQGVLTNTMDSFKKGVNCGGATENGLYFFLNTCVKDGTKVDNLIIFSDMVIGDGYRGDWDDSSDYSESFQDLFKRFKRLNPNCFTVCVNIRSTSGKSVFHRSMNLVEVAGWSDKIFDVISSNKKGYKAIIEEIENIQL